MNSAEREQTEKASLSHPSQGGHCGPELGRNWAGIYRTAFCSIFPWAHTVRDPWIHPDHCCVAGREEGVTPFDLWWLNVNRDFKCASKINGKALINSVFWTILAREKVEMHCGYGSWLQRQQEQRCVWAVFASSSGITSGPPGWTRVAGRSMWQIQ